MSEIRLIGACDVAKMFETPHGIVVAQINYGVKRLYCVEISLISGKEIKKREFYAENDTEQESYLKNLNGIARLDPDIVARLLVDVFWVKPINGEQ